MAEFQNYINGKFVAGGAGRIEVTNPANGQTVGEQALADAGDVDKAVAAAKALHVSGKFSALRPVERGRMVQKMGQYILQHKDKLAELLSLEQGKPLWESHIEIEGAARYFEYYGNQAETVEGRSIPLGQGYFDFTIYEPFGVSAQIIPWNYPIEMTARSLSAALATGNACVIKSPELTPLTHYIFAEAAEAAGLPEGAVNILCGLGHDARSSLQDLLPQVLQSPQPRQKMLCLVFWNWAANQLPLFMMMLICRLLNLTCAGAYFSMQAKSALRCHG